LLTLFGKVDVSLGIFSEDLLLLLFSEFPLLICDFVLLKLRCVKIFSVTGFLSFKLIKHLAIILFQRERRSV
jgi:hypothetical protein